jgi:hypothetical protein
MIFIKRLSIFALLLVSTPCFAYNALDEIQSYSIVLVAFMGFSGLATCVHAIRKIIESLESDNGGGGDRKTVTTYLQYFGIGMILISIAFFTTLMSNSMFGAEQQANDFFTTATYQNGQLPDPEAFKQSIEAGVNVYGFKSPTMNRLLNVLFGTIKFAGLIAIRRGIKIWKTALIAGSDMGGTSLVHKAPSIKWHLVGGAMMLNIFLVLEFIGHTGKLFVGYITHGV